MGRGRRKSMKNKSGTTAAFVERPLNVKAAIQYWADSKKKAGNLL